MRLHIRLLQIALLHNLVRILVLPHVEYHLPPESEPHIDLTAAEATYRQKVVDAYKWLNFSGFDTPDLSLANVPLEEVFVRLTLIVEKIIRDPQGFSQMGRKAHVE